MGVMTSAAMCLALNIYHEARGEPIYGQYAVAQVVLNRVQDDRWPDNVCDVIFQHKQFSWTLQHYTLDEEKALDLAIKVAQNVLSGHNESTVVCADHYHADYVRPSWARNMRIEAVIGHHIFYCSETQ